VSYRSEEQPLDVHLWILCELLIQSKVDIKPLQLYIIAACFLKIRHRMKDKNISKAYYNSLKNVTDFPKFTETSKGTPKAQEAQSDKHLLIEVLPVLHEYIPHLPMSNLLRQSEAASAQGPYNIYTEDTHMEFHLLLCELLRRFEISLDKLKAYHEEKDRLSEPSKFESLLSAVLTYGTALQILARGSAIDKHLKAIEPLLSDHRRDKTADIKLQTMTEGKEEEVDIELVGTTAQPLWKSYRDWLRLMVVHFDAVSILAGHVASPNFQADKIVIKILSAPLPSQAMLSWEDLLNSKHFPAHAPNLAPSATLKEIIDSLKFWSAPEGNKANTVEAVLKAVQDLLTPDSEEPTSKPAIRPVVVPAVGPAVAPAVVPPTVVPVVAPAVTPAVAPAIEPTVAPAVEPPLEPAVAPAVAPAAVPAGAPAAAPAAAAPAVELPPELKQIIIQLKSLKDCQSPARDKCIQEITATLSNLDPQAPQSQALIREVIRLLESLRDGSMIFRKLRKDALSKGIGFTGSLHCELVIASLIKLASSLEVSSHDPATAAKYRKILKDFKVSCIVSAIQDPSDIL
jgi:hypothetical protein